MTGRPDLDIRSGDASARSANKALGRPASDIRTVGDLIAKQKAEPGKFNYGAGTITPQLAGFLLNKAVGTRIMISARTAELLGPAWLVRPVANLRVAGKTEGVMTYEPLARADCIAFV